MAQFKEVTLTGGEKITINMDEISTMQRVDPKTTTIHFADGRHIQVEETPNDIIRKTYRKALAHTPRCPEFFGPRLPPP